MKFLIIPFGFFLILPLTLRAALPVVDAASIAASEARSTLDYAQQLLHELNQQTQIIHVVEQIAQVDDYLDRFGDPEFIIDLAGQESLLASLDTEAINRASEALLEASTGAEMFEGDALSVYVPVMATIEADGERVAERSAEQYKPEEAAHRSFKQYRKARAQALFNRARLREALEHNTRQLQTATTASEVQKLTGVLIGLQTELAASDREIEMATSESITRMLENQNRREVARKADIENSRARLQRGHKKDVGFYQLLSTPTLFNR